MAPTLRMLGIHGLGDHRRSNWAEDWRQAISQGLNPDQRAAFEFTPFRYDQLFEHVRITPEEAWRAFRKLVRSGVVRTRCAEFIQESTRWLRWYAGYIVAWLEDADFRRAVHHALCAELERTQPQVVVAHSLGSMITYDVLSTPSGEPGRLIYVTLGSQLGNPFVSGNLSGGCLRQLAVRRWLHLYNPHDDVFTTPLTFAGQDSFEQVSTPFNLDGWADHDAVAYLSHPQAVQRLWSRIPAILAGPPTA
jgi:hypothetical protein